MGGAAAGAAVAMKRLRTTYEEKADREIAEMKAYYSVLHKEGDASSPTTLLNKRKEEAPQEFETGATAGPSLDKEPVDYSSFFKSNTKVDDLVGAVLTQGEDPPQPEGEEVMKEPEQKNVNIFGENLDDSWDYESELAARDSDAPYVISRDEFSANENEYEQGTLCWYTGDEVLADDRDQPFDAQAMELVGIENLSRFGHGSEDPNIVYVRNDRIRMEWEIVRSPGKFAVDVLGFDDEG